MTDLPPEIHVALRVYEALSQGGRLRDDIALVMVCRNLLMGYLKSYEQPPASESAMAMVDTRAPTQMARNGRAVA